MTVFTPPMTYACRRKCPMSLSFDQQVTFLYVKDLERSERFYGESWGSSWC